MNLWFLLSTASYDIITTYLNERRCFQATATKPNCFTNHADNTVPLIFMDYQMAEILSSLLGPRTWWFQNRTLLFPCHHPHLIPLNPFPVFPPTSSSSALRPFKRYTATQRLLTTCCTSSSSSDANSVSSDMVLVSATVHTDGSHLFQFGTMDKIEERDELKKENDADEVPGYDALSLIVETAENSKVRDDSNKIIVKNINNLLGNENEVPGNAGVRSLTVEAAEKLKAGVGSNENIEERSVNKVLGNTLEGEIDSPSVRGQGSNFVVQVEGSDVEMQIKDDAVRDSDPESDLTDDTVQKDINMKVDVREDCNLAISCEETTSKINDIQNVEISSTADDSTEVSRQGVNIELSVSPQLEIFNESTTSVQDENIELTVSHGEDIELNVSPQLGIVSESAARFHVEDGKLTVSSQLEVISDSSIGKSEEAVEEDIEAETRQSVNLTEDLTCSHGGDKDEVISLSNSLKTEPVLNGKPGYVADDLVDEYKAENSELMMVSKLSDVDKMTTERSDSEGASSSNVAESHETISSGEKQRTPEFIYLRSGAVSLPHPSKTSSGGEDAYFFTGENWLGVADGVSQWSLEGIKPGIYAQQFIDNCKKALSNQRILPTISPTDLLSKSAAETVSPGLCTVLLGYFDGNTFHAANIGDSGFIIIRDGTIFDKSIPMVHEFNLPLLIQSGDDVLEAMEVYRIDLNEGDVIVTATDGLLDNLYEQEIASIVSKSTQSRLTPQEIAELLAMRAQEVGRLASIRSPFADAAKAAGYVGYTGGKLDDVTVLVSVVQKISSSNM